MSRADRTAAVAGRTLRSTLSVPVWLLAPAIILTPVALYVLAHGGPSYVMLLAAYGGALAILHFFLGGITAGRAVAVLIGFDLVFIWAERALLVANFVTFQHTAGS